MQIIMIEIESALLIKLDGRKDHEKDISKEK
jgi:hypothetical protein